MAWQAILNAARMALATSVNNKVSRAAVRVGGKALDATGRGLNKLPKAASAVGNMGFGIQAWIQLFDDWFPSYASATEVTVLGKKGTPSKHVLHTALAAAFGAAYRKGPRHQSIGLEVHVDHMNNAVKVIYTTRISYSQAQFTKLVKWATPETGADTVRTIYTTSATAHNATPWISNLGDGATPLNIISDGVANIPINQVDELALGDISPLGGAYRAAHANDGTSLRTPGAQRSETVAHGPPPTGMEAKALAGQAVGGDKLNEQLLGFARFFWSEFGSILWADPKSSEEAMQGTVARESIEGAYPPLVLRPPEGKYPSPFKFLVGRTIVTRLPRLPNGAPADSPLPPTAPVLAPDGLPEQEYGQPATLEKSSAFYEGSPFSLRTLVAQVLMDPVVLPPLPQTTVGMPQRNRIPGEDRPNV